ncbi:MAG TPA: hypothetical protein VJ695_02615 [Nitrososphaera sp.]|nr:hypothetical protein [Nitrososphaera sp.]
MQKDHLDSNSQTSDKYTHVVTFLPLKSWRHMIPFQLMTSKVIKQAKQSHGIVDYAVKADFPKKHFWTLSIWENQYSMRQFVMADPHFLAMKKFEVWAGDGSAFAHWTSSTSSIDWEEAMRRLRNPNFYYNKKKDASN